MHAPLQEFASVVICNMMSAMGTLNIKRNCTKHGSPWYYSQCSLFWDWAFCVTIWTCCV